MTQIPLHLFHFLKEKQDELPELAWLFQDVPEPYIDYLDASKLARGSKKLASHTFCCYVLLRPLLEEGVLEQAYLRIFPSSILPPWATRAILADIGIALLEEKAEWLSVEIELAVKELLSQNPFRRMDEASSRHPLTQKSVAPEQLILQWYLERLFSGLELLHQADHTPTEDDMVHVKEVFELGENILAKAKARSNTPALSSRI
jgi:hypothetical protein